MFINIGMRGKEVNIAIEDAFKDADKNGDGLIDF